MKDSAGAPEWSVYIARCRDGSLYTGTAKDVKERLRKHNAGKGAAYTRSRRPVRLVYSENHMTHSQSLVREAAIKRLPRQGKAEMIKSKSHVRNIRGQRS